MELLLISVKLTRTIQFLNVQFVCRERQWCNG